MTFPWAEEKKKVGGRRGRERRSRGRKENGRERKRKGKKKEREGGKINFWVKQGKPLWDTSK